MFSVLTQVHKTGTLDPRCQGAKSSLLATIFNLPEAWFPPVQNRVVATGPSGSLRGVSHGVACAQSSTDINSCS